jgi:hypothetical protein
MLLNIILDSDLLNMIPKAQTKTKHTEMGICTLGIIATLLMIAKK